MCVFIKNKLRHFMSINSLNFLCTVIFIDEFLCNNALSLSESLVASKTLQLQYGEFPNLYKYEKYVFLSLKEVRIS